MSDKEVLKDGYFIRYDFGVSSRYTENISGKVGMIDAFLYLGILCSKEPEIQELFNRNGLSCFQICEMKDGKVIYHEAYGISNSN